MKITDKETKEIFQNPTDFKLVIAKHHLKKIPPQMSNSTDTNHFYYETHAESFLFFANLAIESIGIEINRKYNFFNEDEKFEIYKIRDALNQTDPIQKSIYDIIMKYLDYPQPINEQIDQNEFLEISNGKYNNILEYYIQAEHDQNQNKYFKTGWDFTNSVLWSMREIRNTVAHRQLLQRGIVFGLPSILLVLRILWKQNGTLHITSRGFVSPDNVFKKFYTTLVEFIEKIHAIIPPDKHFGQYNNQLDFVL